MVSSRQSNTIAAVGTALFMGAVFLLLWLITISWEKEPEEEGIEIVFGNQEQGGGAQPLVSEQLPVPEPKVEPVQPAAPSNNDLMVQDDEESLALAKQREEQKRQREQAEAERIAREKAAAEKQAREQAAIAKANQLGSLFGKSGTGTTGSGTTQGEGSSGVTTAGKGTSGGNDWLLKGRKLLKALPKPSADFNQEGVVVVKISVDASGKVVSAVATTGTTISDYATVQLAIKSAQKAEFNFVDVPSIQIGTITYYFKNK